MLVWVYPEKTQEPFGAKRYRVAWWELREHAKRRAADEIDFDNDLAPRSAGFKTLAAARRYARGIVDAGKSFFGAAQIQQQIVDWFVEEDRVAEWADVGEAEEVS